MIFFIFLLFALLTKMVEKDEEIARLARDWGASIMRGLLPSKEQNDQRSAEYDELASRWYQFSQRWNLARRDGRTNPDSANSYTLDELYALLNEVQDIRETAQSIPGRYYGVGPYDPSAGKYPWAGKREVAYQATDMAQRTGIVRDTVQLLITEKSNPMRAGSRASRRANASDIS